MLHCWPKNGCSSIIVFYSLHLCCMRIKGLSSIPRVSHFDDMPIYVRFFSPSLYSTYSDVEANMVVWNRLCLIFQLKTKFRMATEIEAVGLELISFVGLHPNLQVNFVPCYLALHLTQNKRRSRRTLLISNKSSSPIAAQ